MNAMFFQCIAAIALLHFGKSDLDNGSENNIAACVPIVDCAWRLENTVQSLGDCDFRNGCHG